MSASASELEDLFGAIRTGDREKVSALISASPSLLSQRNAQGISPISWSAYVGQSAILDLLRAKRGTPDFHEACIVGDEATVRAAISSGADLNACAPDGFTPAALAVFFGHPALMRLLIDAGADVNARAKNSQNVGPIHAAMARGDISSLEFLLTHGADPNAPQQAGHRPLHEAASSGNTIAVALLLMFGADPSVKNDEGVTPAQMARAKSHTALAERLELLSPKER